MESWKEELYSTNCGNDLYHFGILGMKWGIRRYQNKDGTLTAEGRERYKDDIVIDKGDIQRHISMRSNLSLKDKETYLYDPENKHDVDVYEGAYATYLKGKEWWSKADPSIHEYVLTEDLVSPSEKKRIDIFVESFLSKPNKYSSELNEMTNYWKYLDVAGYNLTDKNKNIARSNITYNKRTTEEDLRRYGYSVLTSTMEKGSQSSVATKTYLNAVNKAGYNALIDDNNRKVYNYAVRPIITLNGKKTLKEIKTYTINNSEIEDRVNELRKYMKKKTGSDDIAL